MCSWTSLLRYPCAYPWLLTGSHIFLLPPTITTINAQDLYMLVEPSVWTNRWRLPLRLSRYPLLEGSHSNVVFVPLGSQTQCHSCFHFWPSCQSITQEALTEHLWYTKHPADSQWQAPSIQSASFLITVMAVGNSFTQASTQFNPGGRLEFASERNLGGTGKEEV